MHKLQANNIQKQIGKSYILNNISLSVQSGSIVGLLGPNGAGKTTTFYTICGLVQADKGNVSLDEQDITNMPLHKRSNLGIGYLPQESSIFKDLSVEDNLYLALEVSGYKSKNDGENKENADKKVNVLLESFGIESIRYKIGNTLSGGERRRVEVARAMVKNPKFLLLDEPFAGIDPLAIIDIQNIIRHLANLNIGVLITDHSVRETLGICDRAYVIRNGMVIAEGTSEDIYNNDLVKKYYLGEEFST